MNSENTKKHFKDKVVIVTGGGTGIGLAIVEAFVAEGAKVVISGRRQEPLQAVADRFPGQVAIFPADVSKFDDCHNTVKFALELYGSIDILINNAGGCLWKYFGECSPEEFDNMISVHVAGSANMSRFAWPYLIKARNGRIVNMSSSALFGIITQVSYSTAKAGILGFTRALGQEGKEYGINVNAILPMGASELSEALDEPARTIFRERLPAAAIAPFALWLCLSDNKVSSEAFTVTGGRVARVLLGVNAGVIAKENTIQEWNSLVNKILSDDELAFIPKTGYEVTMHDLDSLGISLDVHSPADHSK